MKEIIFLVEDDPDGGYTAKAVNEGIFTQGETLEELREMVRDAVRCHFKQASCPDHIRLQFVRDEVLAL